MPSAFFLPWLRRARWLAPLVLACVCLAVLAPTLTRLLQSAAGVPVWQVVCGSRSAQHQSVRLMRVDAGGDASRAALHAAHDDCPLCGLQHQGWAPPPTFKVEVPQAESVAALPPLFLHAPASACLGRAVVHRATEPGVRPAARGPSSG